MDPFVKGLLHVDFRANKDTVSYVKELGLQRVTDCFVKMS